jgi:hypothetical protein
MLNYNFLATVLQLSALSTLTLHSVFCVLAREHTRPPPPPQPRARGRETRYETDARA